MDSITLKSTINRLGGADGAEGFAVILQIVYRALSIAETNAPASMSGSFVAVGSSFDAYAALSKIFRTAKRDVLIVDRYLDGSVLVDYGPAVPEGIALRLLTSASAFKGGLGTAAAMWRTQHGDRRPLEVRQAAAVSLHDRALLVDGSSAWILTQSLKDFAKRSPAEIVRSDDTAGAKIEAYEALWNESPSS